MILHAPTRMELHITNNWQIPMGFLPLLGSAILGIVAATCIFKHA
jgi:hypothetical protein